MKALSPDLRDLRSAWGAALFDAAYAEAQKFLDPAFTPTVAGVIAGAIAVLARATPVPVALEVPRSPPLVAPPEPGANGCVCWDFDHPPCAVHPRPGERT